MADETKPPAPKPPEAEAKPPASEKASVEATPTAPAEAAKPPAAPAEKPGAAAAPPKPAASAAEKPAAAGPAKPTAPAKPAGPVPVPWDSPMVGKLKRQFGSGLEALTYLGQNYMQVDRTLIPSILQLLRDEEQFDYCFDITAVHYPKRERQFDIVWILYSFELNERVRVKTQIAEGASIPSVVAIWATANWLEREAFDMFGIFFEGHPDLRRILLDDDFFGYPLRKSFRATPHTVHDPATTQTDAIRAVTVAPERNIETITYKHLGQGQQERLHPGKLTFGSAAVFKETGQGVLPVSDDAPNALPEPPDKEADGGPEAS